MAVNKMLHVIAVEFLVHNVPFTVVLVGVRSVEYHVIDAGR